MAGVIEMGGGCAAAPQTPASNEFIARYMCPLPVLVADGQAGLGHESYLRQREAWEQAVSGFLAERARIAGLEATR